MAATGVPSASPVIEVLNLRNYEDWRFRVETYLFAEDLWDVVENGPPKKRISETESKAWWKKNAKALYAIQNSCGADVFHFIRGIRIAKDAWDTLEKKLLVSPQPEVSRSSDERSHSPRNQSPDNGDASAEEEPEIELVVDEQGYYPNNGEVDYYPNYNVIFGSMAKSNWNAVSEYFNLYPEAIRVQEPRSGMTALHVAVWKQELEIVKELLEIMTDDDLEIQADVSVGGHTALGWCLSPLDDTDNLVEIAACLVERNTNLLLMTDPAGMIPLLQAHAKGRHQMASYLYSVTPLGTADNFRQAAELISLSFREKKFAIAWDLIQRYPRLAITEDFSGESPLNELAYMNSAFFSGSQLNFWERLIYDGIHIEPSVNCSDVEMKTECHLHKKKKRLTRSTNHIGKEAPKGGSGDVLWHLVFSVMALFRGMTTMNLHKFLGIDRIYQLKYNHVRFLQFLQCMCEVVKLEDVNRDPMQDKFIRRAVFQAAERGHVEFITHIFRANIGMQEILDENGRNIFQIAADCRQARVFSLIYGLRRNVISNFVSQKDKDNKNMLHIVGDFSSFAQVNHIRGAVLQMQRELQWFKELESIANPGTLDVRNSTDNMTPRELFIKNHRELMKQGEKSLKETANSCTVVGALTVTIMFGAAFTVAGGNNNDTGLPIFLGDTLFMVFIVSDALSLFTSTTSVMIFLGILTSRYAEDDFLKSLPTKMMVGLLTLFFSIASMMVAFSSTLIIMLGERVSWVVIPISLLACFPIASFVWMQSPLLFEICVSTFGPGIFDKRPLVKSRWIRFKKFSSKMKDKVVRVCNYFRFRENTE